MKLFALIVTRIVHSINLEITTEDTLEAIVNLWLMFKIVMKFS
jgi:hypothetical protein